MRPAELKPRNISILIVRELRCCCADSTKGRRIQHSVLTMNMQGMANYYWNSPDVVVFDVVRPSAMLVGTRSVRIGKDSLTASKKSASTIGPTVHIEAEGDMGWMRALVHMVGTFKDGKSIDMAFRDTAIFEAQRRKLGCSARSRSCRSIQTQRPFQRTAAVAAGSSSLNLITMVDRDGARRLNSQHYEQSE